MHKLTFITHLVLFLFARNCAPCTAADIAFHSQPAAAVKLLQLLQAGPKANQPSRRLQENTVAAADLQQTLQKMLAVPIATPQSVLARGYNGLDAGSLRNWHLLARKLSTPGANVTVAVFGGSVTVGYGKFQQAWKNTVGSWVEPLVANWLKVGRAVLQRTLCNFLGLFHQIWHCSYGTSSSNLCSHIMCLSQTWL
jgi:hypothetical protein